MRGLFAILALFLGFAFAVYAAEPTDAVAEFYAGHSALQQGEPQDAIARFSKALQIGNLEETQVAYVHHYRAIAYQRLDRHQEAIDDYTQALAIGTLPQRVQAAIYYNRAIALDHLANFDRAIKDYSQAIASKPDYAEAYMNRGNAYRKLGDNDAALRDYEASAAYGNPIKHLPYYGEGLVLEAKGDKTGAFKAFQTALLLAPDFEPARLKVDGYQAAGVAPKGSTGVTAALKPSLSPASASSPSATATTTTTTTTAAQPAGSKPTTVASTNPSKSVAPMAPTASMMASTATPIATQPTAATKPVATADLATPQPSSGDAIRTNFTPRMVLQSAASPPPSLVASSAPPPSSAPTTVSATSATAAPVTADPKVATNQNVPVAEPAKPVTTTTTTTTTAAGQTNAISKTASAPPAPADVSSLPTEADLVKKPSASAKAAKKVAASSGAAISAAVPPPAVGGGAAASTRVASASSGSGFLVQVGAFTSEDIAHTEASAISGRYSDLLQGLNQDIQRADLGAKGVYYRLRYGPFGTRDEATERCSALKARGQACVIVAGAAG